MYAVELFVFFFFCLNVVGSMVPGTGTGTGQGRARSTTFMNEVIFPSHLRISVFVPRTSHLGQLYQESNIKYAYASFYFPYDLENLFPYCFVVPRELKPRAHVHHPDQYLAYHSNIIYCHYN